MAEFTVQGLTLGRSVLVILAALRFRPVGVRGVVVEDDSLQIPAVVRVVRILGGDLILQGAPAGT